MAEHVVRAGSSGPDGQVREYGLPAAETPAGIPAWDNTAEPDGAGQPDGAAAALSGADDPLVERTLLLEAQDLALVGSWSLHLKNGQEYISDGMRSLLGLSASNTLRDAYELVNPQDRPIVEQFMRRLYAAPGETHTAELTVRDLDADRTFLVRARAERDTDGKPIRAYGVLQDITKYYMFEREASQDRRLFRDAQRVGRMGTWEWNTATGEVVWSPMLYELFGVPPGGVTTYDAYLSMVDPDDREWVDRNWRSIAANGKPVECEHAVIRPDGQRRLFRCRGEALGMESGLTVMVGTAFDVTEQRSTETRMKRSSQRFTDLVAVAPVGIALFDEDERLVDANAALCRLLDMDPARLRGRTADQLSHPVDQANRLLAGVTRLASEPGRPGRGGSEPVQLGQHVLATAAGSAVYCEVSVTCSVADDGQRFWLVVFSDVTERRRVAERLRYQATHDELTGLPGRLAVKELLGKLLAGPDADSIALLFCDVDNFKRVNDSLGHDAGDELLVALARRLERGLPPSCTAARMSGDEYVVICSDLGEVGGVEALGNLVARLLRTAVPVRGQLLRVSASIGVAVPDGADTSPADLLRFADAAMFDAKARGTGRVAHASAALIATADRQMQLEGQLRDAIAGDELVLHYQPVVAADGTVLSAEALVRWPHPERGILAPGEFLPVAEQGDLLRELDRWVLRTALREASRWPRLAGAVLGGGVSVAVNLSGLAPDDPDFVDIVSAAVAEAGIDWDRVVLELVETSMVDLPARSGDAMRELARHGARFAVDDFGTGYSSLARLKELPAQIIKVDRRFVAGVATDASDFAVARAVVDMTRAMGRSCIAEGVENATQFHVLRSVGVEAFQGWLLSRPVPAKDFRELLRLGPIATPRN